MSILFDIIILTLLELIEAHQIKPKNFKGMIEWLASLLKSNKMQFFLLHLSTLYLIFITVTYEINSFLVTTAILLKLSDIAFKLYLISKVDESGHFSMINVLGVPDMAISPALKYSGVVFYPAMVIIGVI